MLYNLHTCLESAQAYQLGKGFDGNFDTTVMRYMLYALTAADRISNAEEVLADYFKLRRDNQGTLEDLGDGVFTWWAFITNPSVPSVHVANWLAFPLCVDHCPSRSFKFSRSIPPFQSLRVVSFATLVLLKPSLSLNYRTRISFPALLRTVL